MMLKQSSKPSTKNYKDSPSHSRGDVQFPSISTAPQTESREDDASVSFPLLPSREFLTLPEPPWPVGVRRLGGMCCSLSLYSRSITFKLQAQSQLHHSHEVGVLRIPVSSALPACGRT